jgi:hypothetical protein
MKKAQRKAKGGGSKACKVENCRRPYRAKGYCWFHYGKWRRGELKKPRRKGPKKAAGAAAPKKAA